MHAVRLEQAADDAGFDVGMRAEDDDQIAHARGPAATSAASAALDRGRPPAPAARRPSAGSSSCRRAAARRRRTPRSRAAPARAARRTAGARASSTSWPSRVSPKQSSSAFIASLMPSVKNRYRSPALQRDRLLVEQPLEHLAVVELQAEHHARPAPGSGRGGPPCAGARQVDERRVAGARVGHRARAQIEDRVGHRDEAARVEMLRR